METYRATLRPAWLIAIAAAWAASGVAAGAAAQDEESVLTGQAGQADQLVQPPEATAATASDPPYRRPRRPRRPGGGTWRPPGQLAIELELFRRELEGFREAVEARQDEIGEPDQSYLQDLRDYRTGISEYREMMQQLNTPQ